jgi:exodeoxyribonuclease VII large subunit
MIEDLPKRWQNANNDPGRHIYSVSELNAAIKTLLEDRFPFIWLTGEISNFRIPGSGHFYFTLKDSLSQISAVMFRGQQRQLKFVPEDGMTVSGMGRISVYEPRGNYQIILEYMEPSGVGALQIAFEQLKKRLAAEGLFDAQFKRNLPLIPQKIGIITSPSGAVVHDILRTIDRRFGNLRIQIIPVKVQGQGAAEMIESALALANSRKDTDVLILARGGGSLEDLQAFNSEIVARAIFESQIPVVSAVGHETDYTIADFVADLRAPTPTAAAELTVPEKSELQRRCRNLTARLNSNITNYIKMLNSILNGLHKRLTDPRRRLEDFRLRLDDLSNRLLGNLHRRIRQDREYLRLWQDRLGSNQPQVLISKSRIQLDQIHDNLLKSYLIFNKSKMVKIRELTAKLEALSPIAILNRGYSITRTIPDASVLKDSRMVSLGQNLEIMLAKGRLICQIKGKTNHGEKEL